MKIRGFCLIQVGLLKLSTANAKQKAENACQEADKNKTLIQNKFKQLDPILTDIKNGLENVLVNALKEQVREAEEANKTQAKLLKQNKQRTQMESERKNALAEQLRKVQEEQAKLAELLQLQSQQASPMQLISHVSPANNTSFERYDDPSVLSDKPDEDKNKKIRNNNNI